MISAVFREETRAEIESRLEELVARQHESGEQVSRSLFRSMLTWGGAFLLCVSAVVGLLFWGVVLKPLGEATTVMEAVHGGDLGRRIPVRGNDEIARLAGAFNAMTGALEEHQRDLEVRVDEKTLALSSSLAEQRATNERLAAALADLEATQTRLIETEKSAALGTMARGMAHEFNNILGGIRGCAEDLLEDAEDEDTKETLDVIIRTSRRASLITDNLLRFSRGHERRQQFASISEVLTTSITLAEKEAHRQGVKFELDVPALPPIMLDAEGLQQVFLNLLLNAVQASEGREGALVRIHLREEPLCVEVVDEGSGIAAPHLTQIFDPFFTTKEPPSSSGRGGTGLGLSVSLGIMRAMGGEIEARSEGPGRGALFRVLIPSSGEEA